METTAVKKILIVDDEKEVLTHLTKILERFNCEVVSAALGKEALKLARETKPGLIILDIVLPDIDGGEVAYILAQSPETAEIPILFLTGMVTPAETSTKEIIGKHHLMAKPVIPDELLTVINKVYKYD